MYIKLKSIQHLPDESGTMRSYNPGDWVDVGRQKAQLLIAAGQAEVMTSQRLELLPSDCAIIVRGSGSLPPGNIDGITIESMGDQTWADGLPHAYCLFYKTGTVLRTELLQVGFNLLTRWDAVIPLLSYQQTAANIGSPEDRAATKELIGDLRVPAYDTRLLYVRKNDAGAGLIAEWWRQLGREDIPKRSADLAFLRAVFVVKPRLCAAPVSWVGKSHDQ